MNSEFMWVEDHLCRSF